LFAKIPHLKKVRDKPKNMRKLTYLPMRQKKLMRGLILLALIYSLLLPQYSWAYFLNSTKEPVLELNYLPLSSTVTDEILDDPPQLTLLQGNSLIQISPVLNTEPINPISQDPFCPVSKKMVIVTAYSSTPDQTDSSPFITASGTYVRDGIVAANFLKFGTQVKFPQLYGDKIFVVEDRMALKNSHKIDIWMPTKEEAVEFGVKKTEMIIL